MSKTKTPLFLAAWLALIVLLNCAGWLLSGLHQLNATGYAVIVLVAGAGAAWWWRAGNAQHFRVPDFPWRKRRFRRFFPLAFLVITSIAILGGILHAPNNYDALTYRVPRILHWLAAERWHWIHTEFNRVNTRAVGFEWVAAPLMVFTRTDRLLFLINVVSFLFVPGLFFSILTRLGIRPRAAWHWMWLLPTGYSYLLQSASIGNDFFGAFFGLAAWDFALRARASKSRFDIWLSVLAAAMLTGNKLSNLPLLLPWLIALLPALPALKSRLAPTAVVAAAALVCSFLPMAAADYYYCQDWTGFKAENCPFNQKTYALHLEHNPLVLAVENLVPPVFPWAQAWNRNVVKLFSPERLAKLNESFEPSQVCLEVGEIQVEEGAGLGMGVSLLLLLSLLSALIYRKTIPGGNHPSAPVNLARWALLLSPYISLAVFMAKASLATEARLVTPYYGFIIPVLLAGRAQERIVKKTWWRIGAGIVFLLALVVVVITPARPLWPAQTILSRMNTSNPLIAHGVRMYAVYSHRADCFALARQAIPADVRVIGYMAFDFPETSLWRPFGSRRVEHVTPDETGEALRTLGVRYILVCYDNFPFFAELPYDQWLAQINAVEVQKIPLDIRAGHPASIWHLIKLKD